MDGPDVLAGDEVHEVDRIVGLDKRIDKAHIYACYLNECEYFVTEDTEAFITNGRREALESLLGVKIRRTAEFIQGNHCVTS